MLVKTFINILLTVHKGPPGTLRRCSYIHENSDQWLLFNIQHHCALEGHREAQELTL